MVAVSGEKWPCRNQGKSCNDDMVMTVNIFTFEKAAEWKI
jgi:hypothetical protein